LKNETMGKTSARGERSKARRVERTPNSKRVNTKRTGANNEEEKKQEWKEVLKRKESGLVSNSTA